MGTGAAGALYIMAPPRPQKLSTAREFVQNVTTECLGRARYDLFSVGSSAVAFGPRGSRSRSAGDKCLIRLKCHRGLGAGGSGESENCGDEV